MGAARIVLCCALFTLACGGDSGDDGSAFDASTGVADAPSIADAGPDASTEPTCTFNPTGEFNPGIECTWNGPAVGSRYPDFDDVVMTPVVINMTDDNGDSVVDTSDIRTSRSCRTRARTATACARSIWCAAAATRSACCAW